MISHRITYQEHEARQRGFVNNDALISECVRLSIASGGAWVASHCFGEIYFNQYRYPSAVDEYAMGQGVRVDAVDGPAIAFKGKLVGVSDKVWIAYQNRGVSPQ